MNGSSTPNMTAVYRERLEQAVRVMRGVLERGEQHRFNIGVFAARSASDIVCCIAGFCGLDPWFIIRGFRATAGASMGMVSILPEDFFGTPVPFYCHYYPKSCQGRITVEDAIAALHRAIEVHCSEPESSELKCATH